MKGIIIEYFEDKGFGFIKDENEDKRFFHINSIVDKSKFLDNLTDYYYTDWVERNCFVVKFNPGANEKGINAQDIELSNQIFDEMPLNIEFEAKITDLKYDCQSITRTVSGIKKGMAKPAGATSGGNGTHRIGYPETLKELNIYFRRIDDIGWGTIDVRDKALKTNNRSKLTDAFIKELKNNIVGKTVTITSNESDWTLKESSILKK